MFLQQPAVAITDFLLMLEAIILAFLILKIRVRNTMKLLVFLFYIFLAIGSLLGGIVHGFFPDLGSLPNLILWKLTLLSLGVVALFSWLIAFILTFPRYYSHLLCFVLLEFVFYSFYILFVNSQFKIAIYNYIPSTLFLLASLVFIYSKKKHFTIFLGIVGFLLSFFAAYIQQAQISLHPIYFNYNTLYHLLQGLAILFIFFAFHSIVQQLRRAKK